MRQPYLIVIAGVSGSGKSTIASDLARRLDCTFLEGDDFHGETNIAKMAAGWALTDSDRRPWIDRLCDAANCADRTVVVSCSALSRKVREWIRQASEKPVRFALLNVGEASLRSRINARSDHFMPPELLTSQLAALEISSDLLLINAERSPDTINAEIERLITSGELP